MARFKLTVPLTTACYLLIPTYEEKQGVPVKTFAGEDGVLFMASFRTFGGTDRDENGLYVVENTATIECWYDARIKADCHIYVPQTGKEYEIIGEPENIELRNQYMKIRVMEINGGA